MQTKTVTWETPEPVLGAVINTYILRWEIDGIEVPSNIVVQPSLNEYPIGDLPFSGVLQAFIKSRSGIQFSEESASNPIDLASGPIPNPPGNVTLS